jgi:H+/Cl- antiporter ClcA
VAAGQISPSAPSSWNVLNTLFFGIGAGLTAAFFSSLSYLISRHHGTREKHASRRLLIFAHVIMGLTCAIAALIT